MAKRLTATERQANQNAVHAWAARRTAANTAPPAGHEATCPVCGEPSNRTLVDQWGHCMACHRNDWARRVAEAEASRG